jgi:hypothetical protein
MVFILELMAMKTTIKSQNSPSFLSQWILSSAYIEQLLKRANYQKSR